MRSTLLESTVIGLAIGGGAVALYARLLRPWQLRCGATDEEARMRLQGDHLLAFPDLVATRGITIRAPVSEVWPWIAQLGQGRGGFSSDDCLENLIGCDIHSADRIHPEWEKLEVGDQIHLAPTVALTVAQVQPGRALVLHGAAATPGATPPDDFTWAFTVHPQPDGSTRVLVRERYRSHRRAAALLIELVSIISFIMTRAMLRGIRHRVEQAAQPAAAP